MAKTEFILVNPRTSEIIDIDKAEKIGLHDYMIEDENGNLSSMDGKKKWQSCMKIRKTSFKDINGFEIWEDDFIRINGRRATIQYKDGKFYYSYIYNEDGSESEVFKDLIRLYSNDVKKAEYLTSLYRETGYEEDCSEYFNYDYYEDVIVSLRTVERDQEKAWQDYLKYNPKGDKVEFDKAIENKLKLLKKMKKDFEKNTVKS
jgi:hypothetical protein